MAQNIYDNPDFFAGYTRLPRSEAGLRAVYEWAAFRRLLPARIAGLRALDLGAGLGHYAAWLREQGAREVVAVDLSQRMLDAAEKRYPDPGIVWVRAGLEEFRPDAGGFDLMISALTFHYIEDFAGLIERLVPRLTPGGRLAFSVEHPIFTAHGSADWYKAPDGTRLHWPVDRYRDEGERQTSWFVQGVVKYHRSIETYVNTLLAAGLRLARLEEPEADETVLAAHPEWRDERRRPPFLLLAADKPA